MPSSQLTGFRVIKDLHPLRSDAVLLRCDHGPQCVLAVMPRMALESHFGRAALTQEELDSLVAADLSAFARMVAARYSRGGQEFWRGFGRSLPVVRLAPADLRPNGEADHRDVKA
jgi:hypothetical protein